MITMITYVDIFIATGVLAGIVVGCTIAISYLTSEHFIEASRALSDNLLTFDAGDQ